MWKILLIALVLVGLAARSLIFVDETEYVIVTEFGRPVVTHKTPGLQLKWPWQSAIRLDHRLQIYNPRPSEFLTGDKKNIVLDAFVVWRVAAEEPLHFLKAVNNFVNAEARLHDVVWSELSSELGKRDMTALVSVTAGEMQLPKIVESVAGRCREKAGRDFGIEIVDVGLRRLNLPEQNKQSVFDRMRAERQRKATEYRAQGQSEATRIRAEGDKEASRILSEAYRESEKLRGQGDAEATRIYKTAHNKDPQFYELVRTLDAYRKFLNDKTTIYISSDWELLKLLTSGRKELPKPAAPK
jgi:membrane protease subunit HflC